MSVCLFVCLFVCCVEGSEHGILKAKVIQIQITQLALLSKSLFLEGNVDALVKLFIVDALNFGAIPVVNDAVM